jgi:rare lipoprotein A (peptidoglycan hydrolase)
MRRERRTRQTNVLVAVAILAVFFHCGLALAQSAQEGVANFYSDAFQGKKTANATRFV